MAFSQSCEVIGPAQSVCWFSRTQAGGLLVVMVCNAGGGVALGGVALGKGKVDNILTSPASAGGAGGVSLGKVKVVTILTSSASAAIVQGSGMCSNKARGSNIRNRSAFL